MSETFSFLFKLPNKTNSYGMNLIQTLAPTFCCKLCAEHFCDCSRRPVLKASKENHSALKVSLHHNRMMVHHNIEMVTGLSEWEGVPVLKTCSQCYIIILHFEKHKLLPYSI